MSAHKKHLLHELGEVEAKKWLHQKHWVEEMPLTEIAPLVGISRRVLIYWFVKLGIEKRNISQDNNRRYRNMSPEQIKAQTQNANEKTRADFKKPLKKAERLRKMAEGRKEQQTSIELAIKEVLLTLNIEFEEQKPLGPWFVDFYLPKYNLVIECDGDYWHSLPEVVKRDKCKNHWLWRNGYSYMRLKEGDINRNPLDAFNAKFKKFIKK